MDYRKQANSLLVRIGIRQRHLAELQDEAERRMAPIREVFSENIRADEAELKALEKELIGLMKANKGELFDREDQVNLDAGILLRGEEEKVKIPRDALEKIEAAGWNEAIKIAKSVDRGVVECWPDERLVVIGAERKPVESFSYEVFNKVIDQSAHKAKTGVSQGYRKVK
jgi:phage host-nuclease inhibitor protein Gam